MSKKRLIFSGCLAALFIYVVISSFWLNTTGIKWIWALVAFFTLLEFFSNLLKFLREKRENQTTP
ncbi:hypothetical protein QR721_00085 [Aciduricibacillus chroicocephali]|uniref:Uncharacterized protein n=1 Tax=Aciduricibacillus chroicocephali TaxID=3054939 RepID=A0ABY9KUZ7_9BACI|nr:hypothetical protein QR721_00085 [Bacillaceae bacterium 44XB]